MRLGGLTRVAKMRKTVEDQYKGSNKRPHHDINEVSATCDDQEPVLAGDGDRTTQEREPSEELEWQSDPLRNHIREVLPESKLQKAMLWCGCHVLPKHHVHVCL